MVIQVSRFFFSGSYYTKLDVKNRFVLPQPIRFGLIEEGLLEFVVALGLGGSLAIYKKSDIEKIVKKFRSKQHLARYQKFFTFFFSTLHQTTCDAVGRVVLPLVLKKAVDIKNEIVIAGVLDKVEIWSKESYEVQLKAAMGGGDGQYELREMAEEAFKLLEEEDEEPKEEGLP